MELTLLGECPGRQCAHACTVCLIICDPVDSSPPGFSVHGILQAAILEWVVIFYSRRSSQPRD